MKKKLGTMLDEDLIFRAKQVAISQGKAFSQVLEHALRFYLESIEKKNKADRKEVSETTRGAMSISPASLKAIMEEEGVYES
ncbi:MAG: hypothetical protein JRJ13_08295 [Deltaproteobacteria bacterium]|nr:hypothetical protein [Deltaproteobacteria bacterium]MBW1929136.1 hypothetical protein [Deltaproteobacteria bacterium]